jgi:GMP synthase-like glutamine amidotransferase
MQVNLSSSFLTPQKLSEFIKEAKAVFIGGLAELYYGDTDPQKKEQFTIIRDKALPILKETIKQDPDKKILGICFGHQLLAEILGAEVGSAPEQREVGIETVTLSSEGEQDPIFAGIEKQFPAILGHKDAVITLPKQATLLASTKKCPIQAFRYGKAVYGVQFHPELHYEDLQWRLHLGSNESYRKNANATQGEIEVPTRQLIKNFVSL